MWHFRGQNIFWPLLHIYIVHPHDLCPCLCVCLSVCRITLKAVDEIWWNVQRGAMRDWQRPTRFGNHDDDTGIFITELLSLRDRTILRILLVTQKVVDEFLWHFWWWDILLAKDIQFWYWSVQYNDPDTYILMDFLPLRDKSNLFVCLFVCLFIYLLKKQQPW